MAVDPLTAIKASVATEDLLPVFALVSSECGRVPEIHRRQSGGPADGRKWVSIHRCTRRAEQPDFSALAGGAFVAQRG
jgi:hypothetical protein